MGGGFKAGYGSERAISEECLYFRWVVSTLRRSSSMSPSLPGDRDLNGPKPQESLLSKPRTSEPQICAQEVSVEIGLQLPLTEKSLFFSLKYLWKDGLMSNSNLESHPHVYVLYSYFFNVLSLEHFLIKLCRVP